jgi:acyl-CoA synthetase (AMP-forming)/AMP-acid ligase II
MSFVYGLYQVVMATVAGASVVLEKSFVYPAQILPLISEHGVTGFPIVPTIGATLLDMDLSQYDFSTLRYVSSTAAVWPYDHIVRLEKALGFPKIYSMYGLTECKRVSYLPPNDLHRKPGSVGVAIPNSEVMILNEVGHEVPPGDVGQLVVRGGHVMLGYWNAPEATERRLKPGRISGEKWLYTGDLFRRDEDGYLYFVGRVDDMIKSRGEKVSPREIEDLLHKYPGVGEAAVFGVPDIILGEAVVACVSAQSNHQLDVQNIKQYLRVHLEDYKLPRRLVELNEMPRTANGKIDKNQLKKSFLE